MTIALAIMLFGLLPLGSFIEAWAKSPATVTVHTRR